MTDPGGERGGQHAEQHGEAAQRRRAAPVPWRVGAGRARRSARGAARGRRGARLEAPARSRAASRRRAPRRGARARARCSRAGAPARRARARSPARSRHEGRRGGKRAEPERPAVRIEGQRGSGPAGEDAPPGAAATAFHRVDARGQREGRAAGWAERGRAAQRVGEIAAPSGAGPGSSRASCRRRGGAASADRGGARPAAGLPPRSRAPSRASSRARTDAVPRAPPTASRRPPRRPPPESPRRPRAAPGEMYASVPGHVARLGQRLGVGHLREPEVEHARRDALAVGEEDVRRLDVAVEDPGRMRVREAVADLRAGLDRRVVRQLPVAQRLAEGVAGDELVGDVDVARVAPEARMRAGRRDGAAAPRPSPRARPAPPPCPRARRS